MYQRAGLPPRKPPIFTACDRPNLNPRLRSGWGSAYQSVILRMRTDPEPEETIGRLDCERAMMHAHAGRPIASDPFQMK